MSFKNVLNSYREKAFSEYDKGFRFERLIQAYLFTDPKYSTIFKQVWLWSEFPARDQLGGVDTGIDLVCLTYSGDYWAVQCKCYQEHSVIDKPAVDTFLSTSSREFTDEQFKTIRFAQRLWVSTTNRWGTNASEALRNQNPPVTRINLYDLIEAPVDWEKLDKGIHGELARTPRKTLRPHQKTALDKAHEYFKSNDRGKLIMACGTGKTFGALRIAENETSGNGLILFLVPSIALLGQTLREWSGDAVEPIKAVCICSDPQISKHSKKNTDSDSYSIIDLAYPASTDTDFILNQFDQIKSSGHKGLTVVFSTYQSIDVISKAQRTLLRNDYPEFDLIICDEAHRTTGVSLAGQDESAFIKVHDSEFIKAKKRLYMTATPRLYSDETKSKAAQAEAYLCSMDDNELYGDEIYRIGFGEAVEHGLLTDYKVLILTLNDDDIPPAVQRMITSGDTEINTDDASKIIGTINALSKQFLGDQGVTKASDPDPMKRAVAFCANIKTSKKICKTYNTATEVYIDQLPADKRSQMVSVESKHMDGTMSAPQRDQMLAWLKDDTADNQCRIITNVRVLSEGVDVPSLNSVLFLSARNSQVDVVQSVGRVMRKSPGKKYGYIVIPVVVPTDVEANKALDDNVRYKVVWTVLNALRAHDDRFNATVNKIELNRSKPNNILVGRPEYTFNEQGDPSLVSDDLEAYKVNKNIAQQLALQFEQLQSVVFARMVQKVGDRRYWEQWAKDVAQIAERQIERISFLIENRTDQRNAFDKFLNGLQKNINPSITENQAVEMLAQHIITKPIFEALFEGYSFVKNNAVSTAMQKMLDALEGKSIAEETETLEKFYESVRRRADGIDNAEGKQRIIVELYDKFFKTAFPRLVEQLGIVYTPIELVDFIIHSVNFVLESEFDRSISDENIHVLDPFTGTGTFITRLLQSGLVKPKDIKRKYRREIHANEIILLAYYIAAVNIEHAYHDIAGNENTYEPFEGVVLTDTFQLGETEKDHNLFTSMFPKNSERVERQKNSPINVIIGNPPYSIGQKSANDDAQNQAYKKLNDRIAKTYAANSTAGLNKSLYDPYIKAFRWSTDRLNSDNGGIIAFVSNGSWLDGIGTDGFRRVIEKEFSSIWVFNLRGNQRTSGEQSRKEGGKIFGSGSRTQISITLLIKNPNEKSKNAKIFYHDIGDYLTREEKLKIISQHQSINNSKLVWKGITPNEHGDWVNQRNSTFETFIHMAPERKFNLKSKSYFTTYAIGLASNRDAWVYNFSIKKIEANMKGTIEHFNEQCRAFKLIRESRPTAKVSDNINANPERISWTRSLKRDAERGLEHSYNSNAIVTGLYRPFTKLKLYLDKPFIESPGLVNRMFPGLGLSNRVIIVSGLSASKEFSVLIANCVPDLQVLFNGQYFPLYYYDEYEKSNPTLFDSTVESNYNRRDSISGFILDRAKSMYGKNVDKESIFYYVYGLLHSQDYRLMFMNDLKKLLPRIPMVNDVRDFWRLSNAGRELADLHINYEEVPPCKGVAVSGEDTEFYYVDKMRFPKKGQNDTILYNSKITISNIPSDAYKYMINGKSAIEWIMERYQIKTNKTNGITNDPNDWAKEVGNPRYILDLLLSIINVSVQTVNIVNELPKVKFE